MRHLFFSVCGISALLYASYPATAAEESVIHDFPPGSFAIGQPMGDPSGRVFGTSYVGGRHQDGYVYQLTESRGVWHSKTILSFDGDNGFRPYSGVAIDRSTGILYGTTQYGGDANAGTIFSLKHGGSGWTPTTLHNFANGDGGNPQGLLTRDPATGVLFGAATAGGSANCGTAYQISAAGNFQLLYNFHGGDDGCQPVTQLREGTKSGMLFGATWNQGRFNDGTLFLLKERSGIWSESVLHQFTGGDDGANPIDVTDFASDGVSFYGVTSGGGANGQGIAFQLVNVHNNWEYSVIHTFTGGADGRTPAGIHLDGATGIIYGTTQFGGTRGNGIAFKLTRNGQSWFETVLHSFAGGFDGANPTSRPYLNPRTGQLFGTTINGGAHANGTVYVVTP